MVSVTSSPASVLTGGADAVSIQDAVPPDGLSCGSIQHGPHHLVKGLVGVTPQRALGVLIDEATTKTWRKRAMFMCKYVVIQASSKILKSCGNTSPLTSV